MFEDFNFTSYCPKWIDIQKICVIYLIKYSYTILLPTVINDLILTYGVKVLSHNYKQELLLTVISILPIQNCKQYTYKNILRGSVSDNWPDTYQHQINNTKSFVLQCAYPHLRRHRGHKFSFSLRILTFLISYKRPWILQS